MLTKQVAVCTHATLTAYRWWLERLMQTVLETNPLAHTQVLRGPAGAGATRWARVRAAKKKGNGKTGPVTHPTFRPVRGVPGSWGLAYLPYLQDPPIIDLSHPR